MLIELAGGAVYDPRQNWAGDIRNLYIEDGRLRGDVPQPSEVDVRYDLSGHVVMAGAIDLHTHIGGGKTTIARMLLPELLAAGYRAERPRGEAVGHGVQQGGGLLWNGPDGFLPSAPVAGRRYIEMGYTACFEPAVLPSNARGAHAELADTPLIDTGGYVILGNDDVLLGMLRDGVEQSLINAYVAFMVTATQCIGVKVVNAGGINAFKYNQRMLDVDDPHPTYGVTPGEVIRRLARAVEEIGLPHPLHVHGSNLGVAGNIESTLKTIRAADGHRIHLTHVQFHSYGKEGPLGFSSGAEQVAKAVAENPNVTIDVGQVMFGQTVTISADTMHQFQGTGRATPRKSVILDIECEAGCGVVPFRYRHRRYVNALQWAIGLELFLMVDDPSRVFLTTDHPNGGPFTTYPHLIRLLMDRSFRATALAEIHSDAAAASQLSGLDRQYTLRDIATMTRAAPADLLGLGDLGHLSAGAVADVTVYRPDDDIEAMFARPTHVFRRGKLVVRDGRLVDSVDAAITHTVRPAIDPGLQSRLAERFAAAGGMSMRSLRISDDELASSILSRPEIHPCR
ncbi:formylmethanofuran dehydrogenase subunit A [Candidatus Laterigemmans baculatus]|uniref:formylmethanofuran dehydrogenase subunit A n=1 Tax=Candidatus Laterigemmans baculatus TaxID=2770505 RepID=UPI001F246BBC|nr:formylmethanofuran dehydrogenase subunit A [Candidatus Laterigemmans baculatus]